MRIKKGIKNIALLLGTTVAPALASVSCFNVFKILEPTATIIKTDDAKPPAGFNHNDSRKQVEDLFNKYKGHLLVDTSKESQPFLKENNKYYFAKVTHEDKAISSDVYKNDNWKTDEYLPMIFIPPEQKEDLFKKPGSEKFRSKLSDTYIPPVEFNNLLRNYLKGSVQLTPSEHKDFLEKMTKFLEHDNMIRRDFTINSDTYGTFIDKFNDRYDESPYDYNKKIIKREDQFIKFNTAHGDYMDMLEDVQTKDKKNIWFLPFSLSKARAFEDISDIYSKLDENKLWIKRGDQSYYDVLGTPNLLDQFSDPAKAYLDTQTNIETYKDYLLFLLKFMEFKHTFKTQEEIKNLEEDEKKKTQEEDYKKELEQFQTQLNDLVSTLTIATTKTVLGKEVEKPDNQNETRVSMFPVANDELSALITKADYEHSFVWAHRALYEEVIPIYVALFGKLPSKLVLNNNNQINIKKYITYYVNKVMKDKFSDFKEIEDNTDLQEKHKTEEYKKKANEIYKEWLNKWKGLKETTTSN
ncbi:CDS14 family ICE transfer lipoprotein [Mycoplasmopsis agalactiae]|uniref:CDS14 n=1 Tax=Mycoplasmopsis agalactiae TaxID=2110 RepID=D3VQD6_MYCAA|nr:hypothetical protein [Mycoplasmopsis agalactiae]KAB6718625.1 hypothetical protein E4L58_01825 [Mycoplasmopsis agalactiae]CBH40530.1 CDS14 [Mycoplasmopsis agalactiae]CBH40711.1 CDS14 [Mycoplasmopsis agalactiae]